MANQEQLAVLKQGVEVWNKWRKNKAETIVDLTEADLHQSDLRGVNFREAHLFKTNLTETKLDGADLFLADLTNANLLKANLSNANLVEANLTVAKLINCVLCGANLTAANLRVAYLEGANFEGAKLGWTILGTIDISKTIGLEEVIHLEPSVLGTDTIQLSRGEIPEAFLRGCGLSDWEIENVKLYNPELSNEERNKVLYKIYDLQASQAIQISPLFISYSHADTDFVDKLEGQLNAKGIRFWRDIHDMKAGRIETQIDRAIIQNRTVLLVLSEHSLSSDWVEHEVRTARKLEKDTGRDLLCPVALDYGWKTGPWPKRVMEQVMEYNILDFSACQDDSKFGAMFGKLLDGLQLFYKG
jgi:hypothetical protein